MSFKKFWSDAARLRRLRRQGCNAARRVLIEDARAAMNHPAQDSERVTNILASKQNRPDCAGERCHRDHGC